MSIRPPAVLVRVVRSSAYGLALGVAAACGGPPDPAPDGEAATTTPSGAAAAPDPSRANPEAAASVPADTLELTLTLADPGCVPGVCECRGTTERSTGLWRVGLEDRELTGGVHCVVADFDGNGRADVALLGGEGLVAVVMYGTRGPDRVVEVDGGGMPELYYPRATERPAGEPATDTPGLFVPNVGTSHAVFLWNGETFVRALHAR